MVVQADQEFCELITNLIDVKDDVRNQAEAKLNALDYKSLFSNGCYLIMAEKDAVGNLIMDHTKKTVATLIKNKFPPIKNVNSNADQEAIFTGEMQSNISNLFNLYSGVGAAPTVSIGTKFIIGNLLLEPVLTVLNIANQQMFQEFVEMMLTIMQKGEENQSLLAVGALSKLAFSFKDNGIPEKKVFDLIAEFASQAMQQIHQIGSIGLNSQDFSLELIKHLSHLISYTEAKKPNEIRPIADLLINFVCFFVSQQTVISQWGMAFDNLLQLSHMKPRMFSPHIDMVTDTINNTLLNTSNISGTKSSAIRLHSRLFEFLKKKFLQSEEKFTKFVHLLVDLMDDPEDLDMFPEDDDEMDETFQNGVSRQAEIAFDKMCCEEPDLMFKYVLASVEKLFASTATASQNVAGINILCCAGEGCRKHYELHIKSIIGDYIIPMVRSTKHPKIRYTALTALGVVCTEFKSVIVDKLHSEIVSAYGVALMDSSNISVQGHAFLALNNFFEVCPEFLLTRVVSELTPCIVLGLENKSPKIVNQVISTIIQLTERSFGMDEFYSQIRMHMIKIIEVSSSNSETFNQTCMCLLTLCNVGVNVKKEMFKEDAQKCLNIIFSFLQNLLSDAYYKYDMKSLVSSLAAIARIMEVEFEPFVDPSLSLVKVLFQNLIESSKENSGMSEADIMQLLETGEENEKVQIHNSLTETCTAACELIVEISAALKAPVFNRLNEFSSVLSDLVDNPTMVLSAFQAKSAIMSLSEEAVKSTWGEYLQLFNKVYENGKDQPEYYIEVVDIIMETIQKIGKAYTDENFLKIMHDVIEYGIKAQHALSSKLIHLKNYKDNEEIDDEELEDIYDEDEEPVSYLQGIDKYVGTMFKVTGADFMEVFTHYIPGIWKFTENEAVGENDIYHALSIWCTLTQEAPVQSTIKFKEPLQSLISRHANNKSPLVQRVIFFMVNMIAKTKAAEFEDLIKACLKILTDYINANNETVDDDTQLAVDNAISALISIMRAMAHLVGDDFSSLALFVMQKLPLRSDLEETENTYEFIIELIESNSYTKLSQDGLKSMVFAISQGYEILEMHVERKKLLPRLISATKLMRSNVESFDQLIAEFPEESKNVLRVLLA